MVVFAVGHTPSTAGSSRRQRVSRNREATRRNQDVTNSKMGKFKVKQEKSTKTREELVIHIEKMIEKTRIDNNTTDRESVCIYRVPFYLKENNKKSYTPQIVSFGPYHHGHEHLMPMELHKWRAFNMFINRTEQPIELYIDAIRELEEKARACYEGHITMSSDEFTQMLVLDGCFVLEVLKGSMEEFTKIGYSSNDPVFAMRGLIHLIQRDMVLLENQLPLFVLNRLVEIQSTAPFSSNILANAVVRFFRSLMPTSEKSTDMDLWVNLNGIHELHSLAAFHRSLFKTLEFSSTYQITMMSMVEKRQQQLVHCVTELRGVGVKFKKREREPIWNIEFKDGCLEIPQLLIQDSTLSVFSNIIAFEQCHIKSNNHITSYIVFMDSLINTSEDVCYLHYCGIIEHLLGSDQEVADLINRLCKEVVFDPTDSYLLKVSADVNNYYNQKWNAWRAILKHKYFHNPWAIVSFGAAVILLVLTFFQSFYAVYAYYKPPRK